MTRLTVAQALVRFLAVQHSERDGVRHRLVEGCSGIFGHGNVAGVGQALLEDELAAVQAGRTPGLPYRHARNEQGMVHTAVGFARMRNRMSTLACTSSVGPGATNMVTGAALATVNRLPVLLLPGDTFATRAAGTVLQELELPAGPDVQVTDCFRPVSRFFDRVSRPEQLPSALLGAMRVLADPAETGAVTIALPQDVQAEAADWPEELFAPRTWHVPRPVPEPAALARALDVLRSARRPLVVSGGGTVYSEATEALRTFAEATGSPVAETQAGKGSLRHDHPASVGAIGATGTTAANALAAEADVVLGIGTRWQDFTTASRTVFAAPGVRFVNVNVAGSDAAKHSGVALLADARVALEALTEGLAGWRADPAWTERGTRLAAAWDRTVQASHELGHRPHPAQSEVIGAVEAWTGDRDVVVCAAGSMPGDLHRLWRTRDPKGYHVEYGFSCMGYEIAGGLGVALAAPDRRVVVMVGDGSYLMMPTEIATAVAEGVSMTVVLVQNHGYQSIGALSEAVGSQRFGTRFRYRGPGGRLDGDLLPVDLAANAASLGATVLRAGTLAEFTEALAVAGRTEGVVVVEVLTDPSVPAPDSGAWWDVPVAQVSALSSTIEAAHRYARAKPAQRHHLAPALPDTIGEPS
ncbi:3D-(3,5/4)-trihydroxycyclohexane-1,2-dione acylhydrolase (decyclizing) [Goekera deserti]|uniref:3D-(3,5/4)-trihydroxycyclohexane-1,2-dione acylhydrolase (decyclizing) n=1 Tax=Goekera deserti TaxID=2497753 RepID=UPI00192EA291|nr:3D-(3,5/4)-trihydroxycyclohexane-1,2-dione acylhydrolase (decyclizing) [Goekera deserti]